MAFYQLKLTSVCDGCKRETSSAALTQSAAFDYASFHAAHAEKRMNEGWMTHLSRKYGRSVQVSLCPLCSGALSPEAREAYIQQSSGPESGEPVASPTQAEGSFNG